MIRKLFEASPVHLPCTGENPQSPPRRSCGEVGDHKLASLIAKRVRFSDLNASLDSVWFTKCPTLLFLPSHHFTVWGFAMSDSDSELSEAVSVPPADSTLEKQIRAEVRKRFKAGTEVSMTINQIRQAAEESLGLDSGFYAGHSKWKAESKRIVHDEMVRGESLYLVLYFC